MILKWNPLLGGAGGGFFMIKDKKQKSNVDREIISIIEDGEFFSEIK
jgi:hypothetical protein